MPNLNKRIKPLMIQRSMKDIWQQATRDGLSPQPKIIKYGDQNLSGDTFNDQ